VSRALRLAALVLVVGLVSSGCTGAGPVAPGGRPFDFARDTFAYTNDLYWSYDGDAGATRARAEPVEFGQRCVNVVRAARQFFYAARFTGGTELADEEEYRARVRAVLATDPRAQAAVAAQVAIPGYADLRSFSRAHERLLKQELGSSAESYLQRGNWRMILPFSRRSQRYTADELLAHLARGGLPAVRIVNFPVIDINHSVLVYDAQLGSETIRFEAYDPNDVERPVALVFDRASARFRFPHTAYFGGGPVNVYEIFTGLFF
jgi:hypothetical protein